jgi:hypothetical protein
MLSGLQVRGVVIIPTSYFSLCNWGCNLCNREASIFADGADAATFVIGTGVALSAFVPVLPAIWSDDVLSPVDTDEVALMWHTYFHCIKIVVSAVDADLKVSAVDVDAVICCE